MPTASAARVLGSGPRTRTAVAQGDLRVDEGNLRADGRIAGRAAAYLGELSPGLVPARGHGRGAGQDQPYGGGHGPVAAVRGGDSQSGEPVRLGGLPGLQQDLGQPGGDRGPQRPGDQVLQDRHHAPSPGSAAQYPQHRLGRDQHRLGGRRPTWRPPVRHHRGQHGQVRGQILIARYGLSPGRLQDQFGEGPQRAADPGGHGPPGNDPETRLGGDGPHVLGQPALADARLAGHDQRAATAPSGQLADGLGDHGGLLGTADEDRTAHGSIVRQPGTADGGYAVQVGAADRGYEVQASGSRFTPRWKFDRR
jgi:hypothetical protein